MNKTGFGFLRLPRLGPEEDSPIDYPRLEALVDRFLALGGRYFDTAYTYLEGKSEEAICRSLTRRHPRDRFCLADKLPGYQCKTQADAWQYLEESLGRCGVDYFDVYMLHWLNRKHYAIAQELDQFGFLQRVKAAGKAGKVGFSFHDSPELLEQILTEHPEVDCVQLQINYLDWNSAGIQAARCYEIAQEHGKKIIVMEPVKGGTLAALPPKAAQRLKDIDPQASLAAWAIRFATDLEQVEVVLSGMNDLAQVEQNMADFRPLKEYELDNLKRAAAILRSQTRVACTGCGYCRRHCPVKMPIARYFILYNEYCRNPQEGWKLQPAYQALWENGAKASQCLSCGACESHCPQGLEIPRYLKEVAQAFEAP